MQTAANRHVATGHLDCAGEMICRHDQVVTPAGTAVVLWVGRSWMLRYSGGVVEGMNQRGASVLRRVAKKEV